MRRASFVASVAVLLTSALGAQQPNSAAASLLINAAGGPPYPITGVQLPTGVLAVLQMSGAANAPIVLGAAATVAPIGLPTQLGVYDLDLATSGILANGLAPGSPWRLDGAGAFTLAGVIPTTTPTGVTTAYQAAISDPAAPVGFTLTAATRFTITVGVVTQTLILSDDNFINISLIPYNFTIPFYSGDYDNFFVNSNGFVSFNQGSTDFTPTPGEFDSQMPRVSSFWMDLIPPGGGDVLVHFIPAGIAPPVNATHFQVGSPNYFMPYSPLPVPGVRVEFNNVKEFGQGPNHTFSVEMYALLGDIYLFNSIFNPIPSLEVLMGIGPGASLSTAGQKDLSMLGTLGVAGAVNESFYEWFGDPSLVNYNLPANPWDMINTHMLCFATGAGTPQPSYFCTN